MTAAPAAVVTVNATEDGTTSAENRALMGVLVGTSVESGDGHWSVARSGVVSTVLKTTSTK